MKIGVAVVTYNRLSLLSKALDAYESQSTPPAYIIVVNNASTDGTKQFLKEWKDKGENNIEKIVIDEETNTGGAGGFHDALSEAINLDADWIWVADDDAFPELNAFEEAGKYIKGHTEDNIAAVCAKVLNNGVIDVQHRRKIHKGLIRICNKYIPQKAYDDEFDIDLFSYVGTILNKRSLMKAGITRKDFFIHWDDTEHSMRVRKQGKIVVVPSIVVNHDVKASSMKGKEWLTYYDVRNHGLSVALNFPKRYGYECYIELCIKTIVKRLSGMISKDGYDAAKEALKDIREENLGIHDIYKPGWKSSM